MATGWAALFDVDGTLVDSERDGHRVAFNRAFERAGLPYRWDEEAYGELPAITGGRRRLAAYLRRAGLPCVVVTNPYTEGQALGGAALLRDGFAELDAETVRCVAERRRAKV